MTDPRIAGQCSPHKFDVGPDGVTIAGKFVDQRHPAREETVGSQFRDDRRFRISKLQQASLSFRERSVKSLHKLLCFRRNRPNDDSVRLAEVAYGSPFSKEFGIRYHLELSA